MRFVSSDEIWTILRAELKLIRSNSKLTHLAEANVCFLLSAMDGATKVIPIKQVSHTYKQAVSAIRYKGVISSSAGPKRTLAPNKLAGSSLYFHFNFEFDLHYLIC